MNLFERILNWALAIVVLLVVAIVIGDRVACHRFRQAQVGAYARALERQREREWRVLLDYPWHCPKGPFGLSGVPWPTP
jgi:hypothetical protein